MMGNKKKHTGNVLSGFLSVQRKSVQLKLTRGNRTLFYFPLLKNLRGTWPSVRLGPDA